MSQRNVSVRLSTEGGQQARSELDRFGRGGQQSLNRIRDSSRPASQGLLAVNAASREVRSGLEGVARQAGPVGSVLSALGPGGLAAAAGIAAMTAALTSLVSAGEAADQRIQRLDAVLVATGRQSGVTSRQISAMATAIGQETLAASSDIEEAAARLAAFQITGAEAFERTLRLAQDMSAVFGGDLRSNVQILGRALDDPERGLQQLERRFGSLSVELRNNVRELLAVGDRAGATGLVLTELEERVGGAGAAEAGGVRGASNRVREAWGRFNENLAETINMSPALQGALDGIATALDGLADSVERADVGTEVVRQTRQISELHERLREEFGMTLDEARALREELAEGPPIPDFATPGWLQILEEIEAREQRITEARERGQQEVSEAEAAAAGEREARAESLRRTIGENEEQISQELRRQTETRRDVIRREYQERIDELQGMQDTIVRQAESGEIDPSAAPDLVRQLRPQIEAAAELRDLQLREIREQEEEAARRIEETEQRRAEAEAARITSRLQDNARVVAEMQRELEMLTSLTAEERERAQFVDQALGRLQDATTGRVMQVREMAEALFAERQRQDDLNEVRREAERLAQSLVSEEDRLLELRRRLIDAAEEGALSEEKYARAMEAVEERLESLSEAGRNAADAIGDGFDRAFKRSGDALAEFATQGQADFGRLIDSMIADLSRLAIQQTVIDPLKSIDFGGILSGIFGGGSAPAVDTSIADRFVSPPQFASGGQHGGGLRIVGERGPELEATGPARIWSADQTRSMVSGAANVTIPVTVHNNAGGDVEATAQERKLPGGGKAIEVFVERTVKKQIANGAFDRTMSNNFGLNRRGQRS